MGWEDRGRLKREGTYVYLRLILIYGRDQLTNFTILSPSGNSCCFLGLPPENTLWFQSLQRHPTQWKLWGGGQWKNPDILLTLPRQSKSSEGLAPVCVTVSVPLVSLLWKLLSLSQLKPDFRSHSVPGFTRGPRHLKAAISRDSHLNPGLKIFHFCCFPSTFFQISFNSPLRATSSNS